MATAARVSRRKDTAPVEIDSAAVIPGLKQPLFASQGRSSSSSWRAGLAVACLSIFCMLAGMMLTSVMYEQELYRRGIPLHGLVGVDMAQFKPSNVQVRASNTQGMMCAFSRMLSLSFSERAL